MTTERNETVELFQAFEVEELESRLQNGHYGYGEEYYGCSIYGSKS